VRPGWTVAVAVLLFPIGLIALAHTDRETIRIDLTQGHRRTICVAQGVGPLNVRRAFADLEDA
jgi:hypothetical protein